MRPTLAALFLVAAIAPISAQEDKKSSPLPTHLPLAAEACFGRVYDAKHLAGHPKQQVTAFHLSREFKPDLQSENEPGTEEEAKKSDGEYGRINVSVYVRFRGRKGVYANSLNCGKRDDGVITCGVDCDGGSFHLRPSGSSLLLENNGFVVVGGCGASEDERENEAHVTTSTDDKLFRLDAKPFAACMGERDAMAPAWAKLGTPLRVRLKENETLCLSRSYDAAHLKSHPQQTVKRIAVLRSKASQADPDDQIYKLTFRIETKDGKTFQKETTCLPDNYAFGCTINMDHDTQRDFYLTRAPDNDVMLRDRHGLLSKMFDAKLGSDDRMFRLKTAPESTCTF